MNAGHQMEEIHDAFVEGFDKASLARMLRFRLDKNLAHIVGDGALNKVVYELLDIAIQEGWDGALVREAYRFNPGKEGLLRVYEKYGIAPEINLLKAGAPVAGIDARASSAGLQKVIREDNPVLDIARWRTRLTEIETRVCRIDIAGHAMGTGFIVGPETVLTNFHVLEEVLAGRQSAADVSCLFDYKVLAGNELNLGVRARLHKARGILAFSRYSAAEKLGNPDGPLPTEEELDFALLRLDRAFANEPEHTPRGHEVLPNSPTAFQPGQGIIIAQHPVGVPMKLAIDTRSVVGANSNGTRVRYKTNTEGGSSGSPVYDLLWNLLALHHYGDPSYWPPAYNQGIPLHLIRAKISAAGFGELIG